MECLSTILYNQGTRTCRRNVDFRAKDTWHFFSSWRYQFCSNYSQDETPGSSAHENVAICMVDACYVYHDNCRDTYLCGSAYHAVYGQTRRIRLFQSCNGRGSHILPAPVLVHIPSRSVHFPDTGSGLAV